MGANPDYRFIDFNIVELVRVLNMLPGISTMGSCGGHENPGVTQRPKGEWFVTFRAFRIRGGEQSLEYIVEAVQSDSKRLTLGAIPSPSGRTFSYVLEGRSHADPERFAARIAEIYRRDLSNDKT